MSLEYGYIKGEVCNREIFDGDNDWGDEYCKGIINEHDKDGCCSCHLSAPCSYCEELTGYCKSCGWDAKEEQMEIERDQSPTVLSIIRGKLLNDQLQKDVSFYKKYRGEIPAEELEWRHESHSSSSMLFKGVFPNGSENEDSIRERFRGTFGGKLIFISKYNFKYIAYTD